MDRQGNPGSGRQSRPPVRAASLLILLAVLGGCTVGPDYKGPPAVVPPDATAYRRASGVQVSAAPMAARWWTALADPELDRLEEVALAASPDLAAAQARLRQSRAGLRRARSDLMPTTGITALDLHLHSGESGLAGLGGSSGGSGSDTDLYNAGFDASWELDIFGAGRRAVEGAAAALDVRQADLAAAQVSLSSEVASAYVTLRDVQHRTALARSSTDLQDKVLGLVRQRLAGGTASELDAARIQTQVESTRAALLPLEAQASAQLDRLAVLTGRLPGDLDTELVPVAAVPLPPVRVATGDIADLLRRRPDIRGAERSIARANAAVGQHVADYFPKVTLFGNLGFGSTDIGQLLGGGAFTAIGAPVLQWKPFDFGRTRSQVDQAVAARDEAEASYRSTVLAALGDAETSLSRYAIQGRSVAALEQVKASADRAASLTRLRYSGGTASTIDVLDTERQRLQAEGDLASAQAALTLDFISLEKSLGLGWQEPGAAS